MNKNHDPKNGRFAEGHSSGSSSGSGSGGVIAGLSEEHAKRAKRAAKDEVKRLLQHGYVEDAAQMVRVNGITDMDKHFEGYGPNSNPLKEYDAKVEKANGSKYAKSVKEKLAKWQSADTSDPEHYGKYQFYGDTAHVPVGTLSALTGIHPDVITDRRRYLKQLESDRTLYDRQGLPFPTKKGPGKTDQPADETQYGPNNLNRKRR